MEESQLAGIRAGDESCCDIAQKHRKFALAYRRDQTMFRVGFAR
jgi:hypothetical protein